MDILTTAANSYMATFTGYLNQFLLWGQWLFFGLLTLNIIWLALWYAFDASNFAASFASFLKRFFVAALFYTIMLHHDWLLSVLQTAKVMGQTLTHSPIDPSSIISQGIGLCNRIVKPLHHANLFNDVFSVLIGVIVYALVAFVFINVALDLAVTLIITTALISLATFFLGFAALSATSQIARQTLDMIVSNCVKLLGIYLVVAAGNQTIIAVKYSIPTHVDSFDAYIWLVAVILLFWLLAKNLPMQMARIVSGLIQENQGVTAAAMAASVSQSLTTTGNGVVLAAKGLLATGKFSAMTGRGVGALARMGLRAATRYTQGIQRSNSKEPPF